MKKVIFALSTIIVGLLFVIMYLLNESLDTKEYNIINEIEKEVHYTECTLAVRDIEDVYMADAVVYGEEECYMQTVVYEFWRNYELCISKGSEVKKGDTLVKIDGAEKIINTNAKIIDIAISEDDFITIKYIDYQALSVQGRYSSELVDEINYDTPVKILYNGELYDSKINDFGYEVVDGYIKIYLDLPKNLLPGTAVKAMIIKNVYQNQYTIDNIFVSEDNFGTYINRITEENELEKVYIDIICKTDEYSAIAIDENYVKDRFGIKYD